MFVEVSPKVRGERERVKKKKVRKKNRLLERADFHENTWDGNFGGGGTGNHRKIWFSRVPKVNLWLEGQELKKKGGEGQAGEGPKTTVGGVRKGAGGRNPIPRRGGSVKPNGSSGGERGKPRGQKTGFANAGGNVIKRPRKTENTCPQARQFPENPKGTTYFIRELGIFGRRHVGKKRGKN